MPLRRVLYYKIKNSIKTIFTPLKKYFIISGSWSFSLRTQYIFFEFLLKVESQTANMIHDMISADEINPETSLIMLNAIYFNVSISFIVLYSVFFCIGLKLDLFKLKDKRYVIY